MNDEEHKLDARLLIEINSSPMMKGKGMFDTGADLPVWPTTLKYG